jgi:hypothetical protein
VRRWPPGSVTHDVVDGRTVRIPARLALKRPFMGIAVAVVEGREQGSTSGAPGCGGDVAIEFGSTVIEAPLHSNCQLETHEPCGRGR